jgi:hypothetical protein
MKKGLFPLWFTAIIGFVLLIVGLYMAIALVAIPLAFWSGIVLLLIGIGMIAIAIILG